MWSWLKEIRQLLKTLKSCVVFVNTQKLKHLECIHLTQVSSSLFQTAGEQLLSLRGSTMQLCTGAVPIQLLNIFTVLKICCHFYCHLEFC